MLGWIAIRPSTRFSGSVLFIAVTAILAVVLLLILCVIPSAGLILRAVVLILILILILIFVHCGSSFHKLLVAFRKTIVLFGNVLKSSAYDEKYRKVKQRRTLWMLLRPYFNINKKRMPIGASSFLLVQ